MNYGLLLGWLKSLKLKLKKATYNLSDLSLTDNVGTGYSLCWHGADFRVSICVHNEELYCGLYWLFMCFSYHWPC